ncbi:hypothetical protein [Thalassoglobus polymorphus]|uniref:Peptidase C-terminal archaeal/bacterial domain-containing protein n=1 Tax=Thalassoglobus polymorphus TaxID=2527994 RepID=A0A517QRR1_9PLAN|nr:hypothetical protein [Thalassoglobus polymorphus]QDT34313.1 hypothetical protein Mal48_35730 [Thalassoglobus polymorphus]
MSLANISLANFGAVVNQWRQYFVFSVCLLGLPAISVAQLPQTRLYAVSPPGGQIGQDFDVVVTSGADLDELSEMVFSNPKITAKQKTVKNVPVKNTFVVHVPKDVAPGVYEVRCGGLFGFSNPRRFAIDNSPVALDPADNNSAEKAAPVELGQTVNGRLESGNDIDWFRVSAKKGQRITFDVWAERLDSRMKPVIAIFDGTGRRRLKWSQNPVSGDPVLVFDVPSDGEYCIQLRDITYRNGADYFYRLQVHTNPYIEYVWPPVGTAGTKASMTLFGYNLPGGQKNGERLNQIELESLAVEIDIPAQPDLLKTECRIRPLSGGIDGFSYRHTVDGKVSNPVFIGITDQSVVAEVEPNDDAKQAQSVTVPVEIGGQFKEVGDSDSYRFTAKAGEVYYVEVKAERLDTAADPYFVVNQITPGADGAEQVKRLTAQDDVATNLSANIFDTITDDPVYRLQIPTDGMYEVIVRDRYWESRGDPSLRYSLAIRKETPDFRVVAIPSAPTPGQTWPTGIRRGDQFPISVLVFRQDGFKGPVEVYAENLPKGFTCPAVVVGPGVTSSTLIVTSATDVQPGIQHLQLRARAKIEDPALVRSVATATTAVTNASKPIADLKKKATEATEKVKAPEAAYNAALKASEAAPDDASLKEKADAAKKILDQAVAQRDAATTALTNAQNALNTAQANLEAATKSLQTSTANVVHPVRAGTIVWSNAANIPAISRITETMAVTILDEPAPFQVRSNAHRFTVNQGRQILLPVKLEKRSGFDNKVTLTTKELPKASNIDFPNSAFEKGEAEKTLRMFVKENTPPGIYTIWMQTQGQVGYRRNPAKAEDLKKANEAAKAKAATAKQAEAAATQAKTAATTAFTQAQQKLTASQTAVKTAEAAVTTAQQAVEKLKADFAALTTKLNEQKAVEAKLTAEIAIATKAQEAQKAELAVAEKSLAEVQTTLNQANELAAAAQQKAAELTKQVAAQPDNAELKTQLDATNAEVVAQKKAVEAAIAAVQGKTTARDTVKKKLDATTAQLNQSQQQLTAAKTALDASTKAAATAEAQAKAAAQTVLAKQAEVKAAQTAATQAYAALKAATKAKTDAEAAEVAAQALAKSTEAARVAAEKAFTAADTAAKPKNINFTPPTTPIVVEVLPSPAKLAATVPNGGKVKKGEAMEVTVKVTRQNGFTGPVTLALESPAGVNGLAATPVVVPAGQAEGKIVIQTTGEAPDGKVENLVVRAGMDFNGRAEVDSPVVLEVTK